MEPPSSTSATLDGVPRMPQAPMPPTVAPWSRSSSSGQEDTTLTPPASQGLGFTAAHSSSALASLASTVQASPGLPTCVPDGTGFEGAPQKRINSDLQLKRFLTSQTARDFVAFILFLNESARGRSLREECHMSTFSTQLLAVLAQLSRWVDEVPPEARSLRYGNPAYRTWNSKLTSTSAELMRSLLPSSKHGAVVELAAYLSASFGDYTRIDYGTGHETTFCALLYCFARLGVLQPEDCPAVVLKIFNAYLELMRKVQTTYWLEPAGSHGVWGLDDYQCLPFLWGAAQLSQHPTIKPSAITNVDTLEAYAQDYYYLACINFVRQVKKGPLQETASMLCDISSLASWDKVNSGMIKLYKVEVLSKLPIMQHFLFGKLLPLE